MVRGSYSSTLDDKQDTTQTPNPGLLQRNTWHFGRYLLSIMLLESLQYSFCFRQEGLGAPQFGALQDSVSDVSRLVSTEYMDFETQGAH